MTGDCGPGKCCSPPPLLWREEEGAAAVLTVPNVFECGWRRLISAICVTGLADAIAPAPFHPIKLESRGAVQRARDFSFSACTLWKWVASVPEHLDSLIHRPVAHTDVMQKIGFHAYCSEAPGPSARCVRLRACLRIGRGTADVINKSGGWREVTPCNYILSAWVCVSLQSLRSMRPSVDSHSLGNTTRTLDHYIYHYFWPGKREILKKESGRMYFTNWLLFEAKAISGGRQLNQKTFWSQNLESPTWIGSVGRHGFTNLFLSRDVYDLNWRGLKSAGGCLT